MAAAVVGVGVVEEEEEEEEVEALLFPSATFAYVGEGRWFGSLLPPSVRLVNCCWRLLIPSLTMLLFAGRLIPRDGPSGAPLRVRTRANPRRSPLPHPPGVGRGNPSLHMVDSRIRSAFSPRLLLFVNLNAVQ